MRHRKQPKLYWERVRHDDEREKKYWLIFFSLLFRRCVEFRSWCAVEIIASRYKFFEVNSSRIHNCIVAECESCVHGSENWTNTKKNVCIINFHSQFLYIFILLLPDARHGERYFVSNFNLQINNNTIFHVQIQGSAAAVYMLCPNIAWHTSKNCDCLWIMW